MIRSQKSEKKIEGKSIHNRKYQRELHRVTNNKYRILQRQCSMLKTSLRNQHRWVPVAHACSPSYSGGRDQENCGLKPENSWQDPISTKPITKKGWWSG
jgi:hypothetical protein